MDGLPYLQYFVTKLPRQNVKIKSWGKHLNLVRFLQVIPQITRLVTGIPKIIFFLTAPLRLTIDGSQKLVHPDNNIHFGIPVIRRVI